MRTTVDIDAPILRELKKLQKGQRKSLGRLMSDLLAQALSRSRVAQAPAEPFQWNSQPMHLRVDLADREAVYRVLDADSTRHHR